MKDELAFWLGIISFVMTWAVAFYAHIVGKDKTLSDKVEKIERENNAVNSAHAERIVKLESTLQNVPSHQDLSKLSERLSRMDGQLDQINRNIELVLRRLDKEKGG